MTSIQQLQSRAFSISSLLQTSVIILFKADFVALVFVIEYGKHFLRLEMYCPQIYDVIPIVLAVIVIFQLFTARWNLYFFISINGFFGCPDVF